ncbi:MAG: hypothetical protein ACRD09_15860 [Vicinamibacterales bacterium]
MNLVRVLACVVAFTFATAVSPAAAQQPSQPAPSQPEKKPEEQQPQPKPEEPPRYEEVVVVSAS